MRIFFLVPVLLFLTTHHCTVGHRHGYRKHSASRHHHHVLPVGPAVWEKTKRPKPPPRRSSERFLSTKPLLPPQRRIHFPAEFDPVASVLLADVDPFFHQEILNIFLALQEHTNVDLFLVVDESSSSSFESMVDPKAKTYWQLPFPTDSVWSRDYGPAGLLVRHDEEETNNNNHSNESLALLDMEYQPGRYLDNEIPCHLASGYKDWPCYHFNVHIDGGNIMTDGKGNLFMTEVTYEWNSDLSRETINEQIQRYLGVHTIHVLPYAKDPVTGYPMDGTGHIDMFAKLIAPCRVIVAQTTSPIFDQVLETAANYFANLTCAPNNRTYQVFRVDGWFDPNVSGDATDIDDDNTTNNNIDNFTCYDDDSYNDTWFQDDDWFFSWPDNTDINVTDDDDTFGSVANDTVGNGTYGTWYTYTNSLIVNGVIVIPGYTQGNDTKAVLDYQKASPNRSIVVVNTDTLIQFGGSVHCVTIQLPRASNSPNQHDYVIPNISCAELNGAPSCSIQNTSELCQRNYKTFDLGYAPTEGECRTKNHVLERTCCKPASKNSTGLIVLKDESPLFPVKLKFFLDDSPAETSWIIVNTTNAVVASSPLYGSDMACQSVKMDLSLPVGRYEIIVMDSEGNGIAAPCCSAVITSTDFQLLYHDFGLYTSATFVVDDVEDSAPSIAPANASISVPVHAPGSSHSSVPTSSLDASKAPASPNPTSHAEITDHGNPSVPTSSAPSSTPVLRSGNSSSSASINASSPTTVPKPVDTPAVLGSGDVSTSPSSVVLYLTMMFTILVGLHLTV